MEKRLTEIEAIEKIKELIKIKKDLYGADISFLGFNEDWKGNSTKLILRCNKHNIIWNTTSYNNFVRISMIGCPKCSKENRKNKTTLSPIEAYNKIVNIHKDDSLNYNYEKIKNTYSGLHKTVTITCKKHGDFTIKYSSLLNPNRGICPKCRSERLIIRNSKSKEEAILDISNKIDSVKNIYGVELEFLGFKEELEGKSIDHCISDSHLILRCKLHDITWDTTQFNNFIHTNGVYCPSCSRKATMSGLEKICEESMNKILPNPKIQTQFHIDNILDTVTNSYRFIRADFYLPDYNTIVEVDGEQHYKYIPKYHEKGYSYYNDRVNRDNCLVRYCKENSISLLRIPWCDISRIDDIIKSFFVDGKDITTKVDPILLPIKYEGGLIK